MEESSDAEAHPDPFDAGTVAAASSSCQVLVAYEEASFPCLLVRLSCHPFHSVLCPVTEATVNEPSADSVVQPDSIDAL